MKFRFVFCIRSWLFGVHTQRCEHCNERETFLAFGPLVVIITTGGLSVAEIFRRDVGTMAGIQRRRDYQHSEN